MTQLYPQQQQQITTNIVWEAVNISTGTREQSYTISTFTENRIYTNIPYIFLRNNQKGRLRIQITTQVPLTIEIGAGIFQDELDPLLLIGIEGNTDTITYAGRSISYNPFRLNVSTNAEITSNDLLLANTVAGIVKDAQIIVKIRFKQQNTNNLLFETKIGFIALAVANDDPLGLSGPYIPTTDFTHIAVLEGFAAPFVSNIYQALSNALNYLTTPNVISFLNQRLDATITGYITYTAMNGKGDRVPKLLVFMRETSPIAPAIVIAAIIGGLLLVLGIIFTYAYLVKTQAELTVAQSIDKYLQDKTQLANKILNDPNLTPEQKTQTLNALNNYYSDISQNIDKVLTSIRSVQPIPTTTEPITGFLGLALMIPLISIIPSLMRDMIGEKEK